MSDAQWQRFLLLREERRIEENRILNGIASSRVMRNIILAAAVWSGAMWLILCWLA